jgi:hypothetical protein
MSASDPLRTSRRLLSSARANGQAGDLTMRAAGLLLLLACVGCGSSEDAEEPKTAVEQPVAFQGRCAWRPAPKLLTASVFRECSVPRLPW